MTVLPPFPDAEKVMVEWFDGLDGAYTCTALPEEGEVPETTPLVVINRIGGGTTDGITDKALLAVLVIHNSRHEAWALSSQIRDLVLAAGQTPTAINGVLIDATEEATANQEVVDVDRDDRMVDSSYYLSFRRPLA